MAVSARTQRFPNRDTKAVTSVTPADGPSFGTAPAGKWIWMSRSLSRLPASAIGNFSSAALARTYTKQAWLLNLNPIKSMDLWAYMPQAWRIYCTTLSISSQTSKPESGEHVLRCFQSLDCLTQVRAICADSLMTSPSCPVKCRSPFPSIVEASTNWTSPPTIVHTKPTATPGVATRSAASFPSNLGGCISTDHLSHTQRVLAHPGIETTPNNSIQTS